MAKNVRKNNTKHTPLFWDLRKHYVKVQGGIGAGSKLLLVNPVGVCIAQVAVSVLVEEPVACREVRHVAAPQPEAPVAAVDPGTDAGGVGRDSGHLGGQEGGLGQRRDMVRNHQDSCK